MTNNHDELGRMVLEAVANDYEELEMIVSEIVKWAGSINDAPNRNQIEYALMVSIADKDVEAYEYSEKSCRYIPTSADSQTLHTLWFYITEQGKERLQRLEDEETKSGTYMAGWEPDPKGGRRRSST
jgi:hypothetical protein